MARAIDSEAAYRFLSEQLVKETGAFSKGVNKGLNIARSAMRNPDAIPTLTPPNEWVSRLRELDELYTKLHAVTGFTAEQLLEMFAAGYTLEKPDYSKSFEEMASLLEYEKEHADAYYEECGQWEAENEKLRAELEQEKRLYESEKEDGAGLKNAEDLAESAARRRTDNGTVD